jgi:hypothetical protein
MSDSPSLIMIQFLSWVADRPRSYAETMDAWRTSCPRLSVWEDAVIADLVRLDGEGGRAVQLTGRGAALLRQTQNRQTQNRQTIPASRRPARNRHAAPVGSDD